MQVRDKEEPRDVTEVVELCRLGTRKNKMSMERDLVMLECDLLMLERDLAMSRKMQSCAG